MTIDTSGLASWIREREKIRKAKEAGKPKPWTSDAILQRYRFCNVRRMDDRVSAWLLHNIYLPNRNNPLLVAYIALCRFINHPTTLVSLFELKRGNEYGLELPRRWQAKSMMRRLRRWRDRGHTVFNAAYMVRGNDGEDKIASVVEHYCTPIAKRRPPVIVSMEHTHACLSEYYGMGSFMAGQVVADLRWCHPSCIWDDVHRWAPMGPGSKRGMNRVLGRDLRDNMPQWAFEDYLQWVIKSLKKQLPRSITSRLEAMDYQNCLCEYDKYERVRLGEGRPKQLYQGV